MKKEQQSLLRKLLLRDTSHSRLRMAWLALCAGVTLLLVSLMIWWNFREILEGKKDNDSLGSTYITINKAVDATNAEASHSFTEAEIEELKKAPQVQDVGVLTPAVFPANISMGGRLPLSTLLPLEAAPPRFMDKMPTDWHWKPGDVRVPIIMPNEFLNQYNFVFAPSQNLPTLSEDAIKAIGFSLAIGNDQQQLQFAGNVAGFSERITSILAPEEFVRYYNDRLGKGVKVNPSRLIIRAKDPSDAAFVDYLKQHKYVANSEQLKWNRVRSVVEVVSAATGILALLLIGVSALVFLLFIELTLAKAKDSIQLLLQIGYAPGMLKKYMTGKFLPIMLSAVIVSLLIAVGLQIAAHAALLQLMQLEVGYLPGTPVWIAAAVCILLLFLQIRTTIARSLKRL